MWHKPSIKIHAGQVKRNHGALIFHFSLFFSTVHCVWEIASPSCCHALPSSFLPSTHDHRQNVLSRQLILTGYKSMSFNNASVNSTSAHSPPATPGHLFSSLTRGWGICAPQGKPPGIWYTWFKNGQKPGRSSCGLYSLAMEAFVEKDMDCESQVTRQACWDFQRWVSNFRKFSSAL